MPELTMREKCRRRAELLNSVPVAMQLAEETKAEISNGQTPILNLFGGSNGTADDTDHAE